MIGIWGVALTCLREALRSKIFLVPVLFGFVLVGAIPLFPAIGVEEKAKFITNWSLSAATVFAVLSLLFLITPSTARELEERTLHQVLAKPIGRFSYFFGRVLGYGIISLALFLGMGLLGFYTLTRLGNEISSAAMFQNARLLEADRVDVIGTEAGSGDWEIAKWLGEGGKIVYKFDNLEPSEGSQWIVALPGSVAGKFQSFAPVSVIFTNLKAGQEWRTNLLVGQEEQVINVPGGFVGGPLKIEIFATSGKIGLGSKKWPENLGVRLKAPNQGSTFMNWMNAFWLKGLGLFLLGALALLFSLCMNGKLALTLALVLFISGSYPSYLQAGARIFKGEIELEDPEHHHGEEGEEKKNLEKSENPSPQNPSLPFVGSAIELFVALAPDFERFDSSQDLLLGYNYSIGRHLKLLQYLVLYLLVSLAIGGWILKSREMS